LFYTPKSANVFNLFGLFSKEETDSSFESRINEYSSLMKVDATDYRMQSLKQYYGIK